MPPTDAAEARADCRRCGVSAAEPRPLLWTIEPDGRLLCERCTRDNLRAIEARLDERHW